MISHPRNIRTLLVNYRKKLETDTEVFRVKINEDAEIWCEENLENDCWFFELAIDFIYFYITGDENITAFKLRWV